MKKLILFGGSAVCLVILATLLVLWNSPNNSANRLRKNIDSVDELKVFPLPNNGGKPLFATRDTHVIHELLDAIEFEKVPPRSVVNIKMPGALEFFTTGISTQRIQWVACGWGYLRTDNSLLRGDVELTEASSQRLADWLKRHGVQVPERGAEGSGGSEESNP